MMDTWLKARHTEQRLQERRRDTTRNTRAPAEWMGGDRRHRDLQLMVQHRPDLLNFSSHVLQAPALRAGSSVRFVFH